MTRRIDISHKTIFFIAAFLILLWVTYLILDIILLFFVAFILMSALAPFVDRLVSWRIPRSLAVLTVFLVVVGMVVTVLTLGFTPLISQTSNLSQRLAETIGSLLRANYLDQSIIHQELSNLSSQILNFTLDAVKNLVSFVSVIVITFYLLLDRQAIENRATALVVGRQEKAKRLLQRTEEKLGAWLRGQLVLSAIVGVLVYGGLTILGVDFALPLAIIAAILEVIPVIGPIISAIPGVLIALTVSPLFAAVVAGMYLAIQQMEGHIIVPQVMKRAVGLNPIFVIMAVAVGSRLLGIGGALLAVPIAVVIQVVVEEVLHQD